MSVFSEHSVVTLDVHVHVPPTVFEILTHKSENSLFSPTLPLSGSGGSRQNFWMKLIPQKLEATVS